MLSHKMDFNCCANRDGFHRDSHICRKVLITWLFMAKIFIWLLLILSVVYLVTTTNNGPGTWLIGLLKLLK